MPPRTTSKSGPDVVALARTVVVATVERHVHGPGGVRVVEHVVALAPAQPVGAAPPRGSDLDVVAALAADVVVVGLAVELVDSLAAQQQVVAVAADHGVVPVASLDAVVPAAAVDEVVAVTALEHVRVAVAAQQRRR